MNIPQITNNHLSIELIDASTLGSAGLGGEAFQQAIQSGNEATRSSNHDVKRSHYTAAIHSFQEALRLGLDPLRQGYAHSRLGELKVQTEDLPSAIEHFVQVFAFRQALYESVHEASQYLSVVLAEIGRQQEADALQQLVARTQARVGYSLSQSTKDTVRQLVRANKSDT